MSPFAVDDYSRVFPQIAQEVRLYLVLLLFGIIARSTAARVAPRFFDYAFPAEEIGALHCTFFIGGFEDDAVAEIQRLTPSVATSATERTAHCHVM